MFKPIKSVRSGFTLIELLVVIAIISILAAILFPVFAKVREKAHQTACASNERQFSLAIDQYVQDSDETYPWSFLMSDGTFWTQMVDPYLKTFRQNGQTPLTCPDSQTLYRSYSTNGQVIGLFDNVNNPPSPAFYNSVVNLSQIDAPSDTVLLADAMIEAPAILNPRAPDEFAYPHPADSKDHTNDRLSGNDWHAAWFGLDGDNKQVAWLHLGGANVAFCDDHIKWVRLGSLKDANWDVRCHYGSACTGASTSPVYPAPNGTCGDQSPIDCQ